jgi:D-sedoheptulose 7-phosphate isomerase
MHFAEELTGRFRKDRRALGALALGDASHVSCVSNDVGFEEVYARQLEGLARAGDLLVVLSTSGKSANLLRALETARGKGLRTVALLGRGGGQARELADLSIVIPGHTSDRIQEVHMVLIHTAIEAMERELFPDHYPDGG